MKQKLTIILVLVLPSGIWGFVVYSDMSNKGLGYVLIHHIKVISYASMELKLYEVNHPVHDLELVAVVIALKV